MLLCRINKKFKTLYSSLPVEFILYTTIDLTFHSALTFDINAIIWLNASFFSCCDCFYELRFYSDKFFLDMIYFKQFCLYISRSVSILPIVLCNLFCFCLWFYKYKIQNQLKTNLNVRKSVSKRLFSINGQAKMTLFKWESAVFPKSVSLKAEKWHSKFSPKHASPKLFFPEST